MNVVKRLFKIQNLNASTIRTVMVADCSRFDSPDLLLDAGAPGTDSSRVFDLGSDGEDEESDRGPTRAKGLRRLLDGLLEGRAQPPLPESTLETKVAELLAQGHTKPPEQGRAAAGNKLLIFTTGCLTYSPHQIGEGPGAGPSMGRVPSSVCPGGPSSSPTLPPTHPWAGTHSDLWVQGSPGNCQVPRRRRHPRPPCRHQADLTAPDDHSRARSGRGPGLRRLLRCAG